MSMWVCYQSTPLRVGRFNILGVDFGCFSTKYGDCEALEKREEQVNFTLFVYVLPITGALCMHYLGITYPTSPYIYYVYIP